MSLLTEMTSLLHVHEVSVQVILVSSPLYPSIRSDIEFYKVEKDIEDLFCENMAFNIEPMNEQYEHISKKQSELRT